MSIYTEVQLCCDGAPGDERFDCTNTLFANTAQEARRVAREAGWLVGRRGGRDWCPIHKGREWYPS